MLKAVAVLSGDQNLKGVVTFSQENANTAVQVDATFENLPKGAHGFHIHEFGDRTNGCTSAGAHFNPHNARHGGPGISPRHVGDMGNVISNGDPKTHFSFEDSSMSLFPPYCIVGRSCVIHRDEDDLGQGNYEDSPTTGHSGPRLACGVIGWSASS